MERANAGFVYTVETIKDGKVIDREVVHNLIPYEGVNHMINVAMKSATAYTTWYVGLVEGSYQPVPNDTMATFPALASECSAYVESARQTLTLGTASNGSIDNSASKAIFTGNTDGKYITGGFISSSPGKGSTAGVLLSAVRFSSPKSLDNGSILRVTAGFTITSL